MCVNSVYTIVFWFKPKVHTILSCDLALHVYIEKVEVVVLLSLSDFFCFVYLCFVNLRGGFLFSIFVETYDIFVE